MGMTFRNYRARGNLQPKPEHLCGRGQYRPGFAATPARAGESVVREPAKVIQESVNKTPHPKQVAGFFYAALKWVDLQDS